MILCYSSYERPWTSLGKHLLNRNHFLRYEHIAESRERDVCMLLLESASTRLVVADTEMAGLKVEASAGPLLDVGR